MRIAPPLSREPRSIAASQIFFSKCLIFDVPQYSLNIQVDLIILKTDDKHFTLTTKKSLHVIFNACGE